MAKIQTELLFYRDPATPIQGPASTTLQFPGAALSASTVRWFGAATGQTLHYARWLLVWTPGDNTTVQLSHADSGPTNFVEIARFTRSSPTPVADAIDVTVALQSALALGVTKHLCQRMNGNGSVGPKVYSSSIELIWDVATGTDAPGAYDDSELRARLVKLERTIDAMRDAWALM